MKTILSLFIIQSVKKVPEIMGQPNSFAQAQNLIVKHVPEKVY